MESILTPELAANIGIGLASGIFSAFIASLIMYKSVVNDQRKRLRKKFGKAEGEYNCYSFDKINPELSGSDPGNFTKTIKLNGGKAIIKYQDGNALSIIVTEKDGYQWEGDILMELETMGSIAWRYTNLPLQKENEWHWFGLKRCIIREEEHYIFIYLIGEVDEGFGNEVLIRKKFH